ncbi:transposase [Nitzschia inconspicua]|uniref:Transposase n=1 Tax=Nitzschia inconspicua TaxID=303405 RepID=A0A9K3M0T6_9STRA|nr:transposase [Nitzschia inconspicua]
MYRYTERVCGALADWQELVECINQTSAAPGESRPTLSISRKQLSGWFRKQGGKEVSAIEKPLLTLKHRQQRVQWAKKWYHLLSNSHASVAFLDEKWIYTTNRRRPMKILPPTELENGKVRVYQPP